jgi:hypothetical protein
MTGFPTRASLGRSLAMCSAYVVTSTMTTSHAPPTPTFPQALAAAVPSKPCQHGPNGCKGFPANWANRANPAVARVLAKKFLAMKFETATKQHYGRLPGQSLAIWMIRDAAAISLANLATPPQSDRALVVARIEADMTPTAPRDDYYDIGPRSGMHLRKEFFLVVDDFTPLPNDVTHDGYPVSRWSVYGIDSVPDAQGKIHPQLVELPDKHGFFRLCAVHHPAHVRSGGGQFLSCPDATAYAAVLDSSVTLRAVLRGRSIFDVVFAYPAGSRVAPLTRDAWTARVTTQLTSFLRDRSPQLSEPHRQVLLRVLVNAFEAPAWVPCGLGCCTGDS